MKETQKSTINDQFKKDCKVIYMKREYPSYIGTIKWVIITDLSKEELFLKYPEQIKSFTPFIRLSLLQGEPIYESELNTDKFRKRQKNNEDSFGYDDELTGVFHHEAYAPDYIEMKEKENLQMEREALLNRLPEVLGQLSLTQRQRIEAYFYEERTARDIADDEGVSHTAVIHSINAALKKLRKLLK